MFSKYPQLAWAQFHSLLGKLVYNKAGESQPVVSLHVVLALWDSCLIDSSYSSGSALNSKSSHGHKASYLSTAVNMDLNSNASLLVKTCRQRLCDFQCIYPGFLIIVLLSVLTLSVYCKLCNNQLFALLIHSGWLLLQLWVSVKSEVKVCISLAFGLYISVDFKYESPPLLPEQPNQMLRSRDVTPASGTVSPWSQKPCTERLLPG